MIDLILMSERADINLMSSLPGTPLHLACKIGNLKIVQQLLINGADIQIKCIKNGKLAKDSTDNQRVVYLIEKYEKLRALELEQEDSSNSKSSGDEQEQADDEIAETQGHSSSSSGMQTPKLIANLANKVNFLARSNFSSKPIEKKQSS